MCVVSTWHWGKTVLEEAFSGVVFFLLLFSLISWKAASLRYNDAVFLREFASPWLPFADPRVSGPWSQSPVWQSPVGGAGPCCWPLILALLGCVHCSQSIWRPLVLGSRPCGQAGTQWGILVSHLSRLPCTHFSPLTSRTAVHWLTALSVVFWVTALCACSLTVVIRMSSEVCQLCLEALTPLAEQCAKAQETDAPLFLATRHFLKVRLWAFLPGGSDGFVPDKAVFLSTAVSGAQLPSFLGYHSSVALCSWNSTWWTVPGIR